MVKLHYLSWIVYFILYNHDVMSFLLDDYRESLLGNSYAYYKHVRMHSNMLVDDGVFVVLRNISVLTSFVKYYMLLILTRFTIRDFWYFLKFFLRFIFDFVESNWRKTRQEISLITCAYFLDKWNNNWKKSLKKHSTIFLA